MSPRGTTGDRTAIVIAGGGTAGHVLPGLAVAEALVDAGVARADVHVVGDRKGMEATMVPAAGFPVHLYDLRNFPRRPTVRHVVSAAKLLVAVGSAHRLLGRLRPRVVLSVGGYASVPTVVAARLRRVPIVNLSYDALPGKASKLAARVAAANAVAFPDSPLPRPVLTGAPLRREILAVDRDRDRDAARARLGLPLDRLVVGVVGGSLGSMALIDAARDLADRWADRRDLAIHLVAGNRWIDRAPAPRSGADGVFLQVTPFEPRLDLVYAAVDVLVARSGATTVAEIAAVGVPSVLVPWPLAAEDHQTVNARWLADAGGAVLLPEPDVATRLAPELERLLTSPGDRRQLAVGARTVGRRDAAAAVAALVLEVGAT